jgi:thiamine biosynthesis protein ThiS
MRLTVNGTERQVAATTVAQLIGELSLESLEFLALSRNGTIVKRADWTATDLAAGDTIDILTIVGGG